MTSVNMHEAKTNLSRLVDEAVAGEEVIIAKAGKPAVRLVPVEPMPARQFGLLKGQIQIGDDFDAPLPDEVLAGFEGT
jgi:prevent-host-death family protein